MTTSVDGSRRIDVLLSPAELQDPGRDRGVIVVDVLRATTVIARALASGARRIVPAGSLEDAFDLKRKLGPDALLCGERDGRRVDGFDLGNSPLEYVPEVVRGRTLILASTNGTVMLSRVSGARRVLTAALTNSAAVARAVVADGGCWTIVPSGKLGRACLEDLLCAGRILGAPGMTRPDPADGDDAARLVLDLHARTSSDLASALREASHGQYLVEIGHERDIEACAAADTLDVVPEMSQGWITASIPE